MSLIGNIIWFLFGGIFAGLAWFFFGLLWCITIIGIPVGLQCFKFGVLSFFPFGKDVELSSETTSLILNIFWLIFGGVELAITHAFLALFCAARLLVFHLVCSISSWRSWHCCPLVRRLWRIEGEVHFTLFSKVCPCYVTAV